MAKQKKLGLALGSGGWRGLAHIGVIKKLIEEVAPKYVDRSGGYTRIVKTGERDGDRAPMARIELVKGKSTPKSSTKKKGKKNDK